MIFHPILKDRVWGGRCLESLYGKTLPSGALIGESWEISDRPGDVSIISNGPLRGKDLHWLLENYQTDLLGDAKPYRGRFPLLIKILDAREKLSLQVHPPAALAAQLGGEPKTELWYIAHADPDAELYVGLKRGCTRELFVKKLQQGTVAECFHRVRVQAGDAMFLPSGRVHAIGAGMVIFEIQQNSDTTYRVFDWNRLGLDGKPRPLHVEQSLQSIDFGDFEPELLRPQPSSGASSLASLIDDRLFGVQSARLSTGENWRLEAGRMQIVATVSGNVRLRSLQEDLLLAAGQFCLVPACVAGVTLTAQSAANCLCINGGKADAS